MIASSQNPSSPRPIGCWNEIVELLAECAESSRSEVVRRLRFECESLGNNVRAEIAKAEIVPFVWTDRLVQWYERTDAFLFESLVWNNTPTKIAMRRWLVEYLRRAWPRPGRILCFGDGLGLDTAALAKAGHRLAYYEPSQRCSRFADEVFRRNEVVIERIDSIADLQPGSFDAVVCLDVLEHVPDAPGMVEQLASFVRPGGLLAVHAPFWYLNATTPTHLKVNRRFSGRFEPLYSTGGLKLVAGRMLWNPIVSMRASGEHAARLSATDRVRLLAGSMLIRFEMVCSVLVSPITRAVLRYETRALRKHLNGV
jgi:SAM-dependent methyltransferase